MNFFNFGLVTDRQTDRQTESDAYEPTVHWHRWAKKGSCLVLIGQYLGEDINLYDCKFKHSITLILALINWEILIFNLSADQVKPISLLIVTLEIETLLATYT